MIEIGHAGSIAFCAEGAEADGQQRHHSRCVAGGRFHRQAAGEGLRRDSHAIRADFRRMARVSPLIAPDFQPTYSATRRIAAPMPLPTDLSLFRQFDA